MGKKRQHQSGKGRRKDVVIGNVVEEAGGLITWHIEERAKTRVCVQKK